MDKTPQAPDAGEVEAACALIAQIAKPMQEQRDLLSGEDRKLMDSLIANVLGIASLLRRLAVPPREPTVQCRNVDMFGQRCTLPAGHQLHHRRTAALAAQREPAQERK